MRVREAHDLTHVVADVGTRALERIVDTEWLPANGDAAMEVGIR